MKKYRWSVTLGDRRIIVVASDKFEATKTAAREWKVLWSKMARDMIVAKLGEVKDK